MVIYWISVLKVKFAWRIDTFSIQEIRRLFIRTPRNLKVESRLLCTWSRASVTFPWNIGEETVQFFCSISSTSHAREPSSTFCRPTGNSSCSPSIPQIILLSAKVFPTPLIEELRKWLRPKSSSFCEQAERFRLNKKLTPLRNGRTSPAWMLCVFLSFLRIN